MSSLYIRAGYFLLEAHYKTRCFLNKIVTFCFFILDKKITKITQRMEKYALIYHKKCFSMM